MGINPSLVIKKNPLKLNIAMTEAQGMCTEMQNTLHVDVFEGKVVKKAFSSLVFSF